MNSILFYSILFNAIVHSHPESHQCIKNVQRKDRQNIKIAMDRDWTLIHKHNKLWMP